MKFNLNNKKYKNKEFFGSFWSFVNSEFNFIISTPAPRSGDNRNLDKLENQTIKMPFHTSDSKTIFDYVLLTMDLLGKIILRVGNTIIHKTTLIFNVINNTDND